MTEGQPGVKRLLGLGLGPVVGKILQSAGLRILNRQRLLVIRLESPPTGVYGNHVPSVRRNSDGHRQAIEPLRMPRNLPNQLFAGGQIDGLT